MRIRALLLAPALAFSLVAQVQPHSLFDAPVLQSATTEENEWIADVDNDGDLDLVAFQGVANSALKTSFRARLNDGVGNFTFGPAAAIPAQSGTHVLVADVTGDGIQDVVVATLTTNALGAGLLIYPGLPGANFAPPQHVSLPGNVLLLRSGSDGGDGIADVLAVHGMAAFGLTATWILGSVGPSFPIGPVAVLASVLQEDSEVLDADGDGVTDLAMLEVVGATSTLVVRRTTPTGFVPYASVPLQNAIAHSVVRLDLEGDGDDDLLVWDVSAPSTTMLRPVENRGGGVFVLQGPQTLSGISPFVFAASDLDSDGDSDLVVRSSSTSSGHTIAILRNALGTFTWTRSGSCPIATIGGGAGIADLDSDGIPDFADARAIWFLPPRLDSETQPLSSGLEDWDLDGDLDRVERPNLRRHDGNGVFVATTMWPAAPAADQFYGDPLGTGDFDGDGLREVIVALVRQVFTQQTFLGLRRLEANGDDVLGDQGPAAIPSVRMNAGAFADDLDGNGTLDLLDNQGAWLNDGLGGFTFAPLSFQGYSPVAKGDVDGDGDSDFLAILPSGPGAAMLMRTSPQGFTVVPLITPPFVIDYSSAVLVDLDDDGDLDVACRERQGTGPIRTNLFVNNAGVFTSALVLAVQGQVSAGDLDGDGLTDVCVQATDRLHVLLRVGPGLVYAPALEFGIRGGTSLGDLDQDGDLDLFGTTRWNRRFEPPDAGLRRQYGIGGAATGGRRPQLSAVGPIRASLPLSMRLSRAVGGTIAVLVFSNAEANVPNVLPGLTAYVASIDAEFAFVLSGAPLQAGAGGIDASFPLPPGTAGFTVFAQFVALDAAAPSGLAHSNGVELRIGQ